MRILLPSLLLIAVCAPGASALATQVDDQSQAALDRELAGFTPGRPMTCMRQTELRGSRSIGDTIVYENGRNERVVNRTGGGCERHGDWGYLVTRTSQSQLCRGDIATVVDRTTQMPIGSCVYGDFTTYTRRQ